DEIEAKFIGVDRKNRTITLSIKAKEYAEEAEALQDYSHTGAATTSLGDILKEQMGDKRK
ncbi:MAG: 30S ribosomal protein S1, partial [Pseudomonadota bacterium]|nr:30S ribosomal protein S1 [Pseudomonadota bacterium]